MTWIGVGSRPEGLLVGQLDLAGRLRHLLESRQVSIRDVAARAGMQPKQVHRIVSGATRNPGLLTVQRIVEAAGGTLHDVLCWPAPGGPAR